MGNTAELILENYEIQRVICGNLCVPNVDIAFTVFSKNGNLNCTCQQYGKTDVLWPHVAVVAEKEGLLETFISSYIETGGNRGKVLNNTPANAGDKLKRKNQDVVETASVRVSFPLYKANRNKQLLILKLTFQRENCLQNIIKTMKNFRFSLWTI